MTYTTPCDWFALCVRPADGVVQHPIIGAVNTCEPCATKLGLPLDKDHLLIFG